MKYFIGLFLLIHFEANFYWWIIYIVIFIIDIIFTVNRYLREEEIFNMTWAMKEELEPHIEHLGT